MRTLSKIFRSILALSLLCFLGFFALLFVPLQAYASFFSSLLGEEAYAQADQVVPAPSSKNSQTMDLLQASVSSASILQDPKGFRQGGTYGASKNNSKDAGIDPNATINIVSDNAILPATGPMGVSDGKDIVDASSEETSVYVVRKGDTISAIADMFGVSVNTILSANDMKKGEKLAPGDVLFILPISGIEHTVIKGQTLQSIAKLYKTDINDIIFYNGIAQDAKLAVGDKIVIPGADNMADEGGDKPASNLGSAPARDQNYYATHPLQNLLGYFINPVPIGYKTQGLHGPGHRGIDIGAPKGTPIYASATGTVSIVKSGCKVGRKNCGGGYGNMVIIEHSNGTKTLYAHMTSVDTHIGDQVAQAQVIGYVGSTGRSTGSHLHFEVFNAKNPGADWSWANGQVASTN